MATPDQRTPIARAARPAQAPARRRTTSDPILVIRELTRPMRALLIAAGVLVFLAGVQLFVFPLETERFFAWTVNPPMTAVFLGASYWAAGVFEWTAARSRSWAGARVAVPGVFLFTALTFAVTMVHLDRFHLGPEFDGVTRAVTWVWIGVYAVVPVLLLGVWIRQAMVPGDDPPRSDTIPRWLAGAIAVQSTVLGAAGLVLLLAPAWSDRWWPWTISPLTGRAIGAWLFSLGVVGIHSLWERDPVRMRPAAAAAATFAMLQTVALARHGDDVDWTMPAAWALVAVLVLIFVTGFATLSYARSGFRSRRLRPIAVR